MSLEERAAARLAEKAAANQCKTCKLIASTVETDERIRYWVQELGNAAEVAALLREEYGDQAPGDTTLRRHLKRCGV